jgi:hypothetical protein
VEEILSARELPLRLAVLMWPRKKRHLRGALGVRERLFEALFRLY